VQYVFHSLEKGTKELRGVVEIKEEILTRGPVVSVGFSLRGGLLD